MLFRLTLVRGGGGTLCIGRDWLEMTKYLADLAGCTGGHIPRTDFGGMGRFIFGILPVMFLGDIMGYF